jgi:hypothetical protein
LRTAKKTDGKDDEDPVTTPSAADAPALRFAVSDALPMVRSTRTNPGGGRLEAASLSRD